MMTDFKKHFSHYFSLIGIIVITIIGFFVFSYDKNFQLAIIASACVAYFIWGLIHHLIHKDLNLQVIIEYAVVASLGFVIGISVMFRG